MTNIHALEGVGIQGDQKAEGKQQKNFHSLAVCRTKNRVKMLYWSMNYSFKKKKKKSKIPEKKIPHQGTQVEGKQHVKTCISFTIRKYK